MADADFPIGYLARKTGCKVQTIRYYEQVGLMPEPHRTSGNQRVYGPTHIQRLRFIRHARELGFSQDEVRELLRLSDNPEQPCKAVTDIAQRHLAEVNHKFVRLKALRGELKRMITQCGGTERIANCRIIEALANLHDV